MEKSGDIMIFSRVRMLKDVARTLPQRSDTLQMPGGKGMAQSLVKKMTLMVCRVSRRFLKTQEISKRASDIILQSWNKEYGNSMRRTSCKRWFKYCHRKHVHCDDPSISKALDFLVELYDQGIGYSAMNTARSALTCILTRCSIYTVTKFLKVVFESRPTVSRYTDMGCRDSPAAP